MFEACEVKTIKAAIIAENQYIRARGHGRVRIPGIIHISLA